MQVTIYQGRTAAPTDATITIVVDVIRAFTVAYYAFLQGANRIILAETVDQAFQLKKENPDYLLAGEVEGLPVEGFDFGNSPHQIRQQNLTGKTLVQKTTNGVRATLNNLISEHLFVTGFTSARNTAVFVRDMVAGKNQPINIIASHASGDDDLACAKYIKSILEDSGSISAERAIERIKHSQAAEKFFDDGMRAFAPEDIFHCIEELETDFVMKVNKGSKIPTIEGVYL